MSDDHEVQGQGQGHGGSKCVKMAGFNSPVYI